MVRARITLLPGGCRDGTGNQESAGQGTGRREEQGTPRLGGDSGGARC